ncbi:MAG: hypothetical protein ACTS3F_13850 [Phycisphaerales bacterium]
MNKGPLGPSDNQSFDDDADKTKPAPRNQPLFACRSLRPDSIRTDLEQFEALVQSVGVHGYAARVGLHRRQINRMRSGAQPNPINRLLLALEAATPDARKSAAEYLCAQLNARFVPNPATPHTPQTGHAS